MEQPNNNSPTSRKPVGYRDLSDQELDAINRTKALGQQIGEVLNNIAQMPGVDQRWLAIGRTDLQTGLMAVTRAIAKPTTF